MHGKCGWWVSEYRQAPEADQHEVVKGFVADVNYALLMMMGQLDTSLLLRDLLTNQRQQQAPNTPVKNNIIAPATTASKAIRVQPKTIHKENMQTPVVNKRTGAGPAPSTKSKATTAAASSLVRAASNRALVATLQATARPPKPSPPQSVQKMTAKVATPLFTPRPAAIKASAPAASPAASPRCRLQFTPNPKASERKKAFDDECVQLGKTRKTNIPVLKSRLGTYA